MINVLSPGLYSTIQDLGRTGYRKYGVPVSGAVDQYSAKLANQILGNAENSAVLEITLIGPMLKFNEACQIVITGAEFEPILNDCLIENNSIISIEKGSILKFGAVKEGMRAYLAIPGGFDSEIMMGSVSFYPSITSCSHLKKGDQLFFGNGLPELRRQINPTLKTPNSLYNKKLTVFKGPEFNLLPSELQGSLFNSKFEISSQSNRMGSRLIGVNNNLFAAEIITSPVQPGTVQLTPSGQLIVLGRDAQTTGGYARVLQLTETAQDCLGQIQFGAFIHFTLI